MDVTLVRSSVFALPANKRVGAIFHGGAADLGLWPGAGADADLREAWGAGLEVALAKELGGRSAVPLGEPVRVPPGRLHCDFLLWISLKDPEPGAERSAAPDAARLRDAVVRALSFAASRGVERVAMGALGEGVGELPRAERLAVCVLAATEYEERCFAEGKPAVVEEVVVCEPLGAVLRQAQQKVGRLARSSEPAPSRPAFPVAKRRRSAATSPRGRKKAARPKGLSAEEAASGRAAAERYDIHRTYAAGDYLLHPKFGVGLVASVTDAQAMVVRFEDGSERKMVHGR